MAKIIKLNGEEVSIGTDDGKIRKVSINDVHFTPVEGDEVEIFESDGEIVVTKKERENIEQVNNYVVQNNGTDNVRVSLYIAIIVSMLACFLPIISISILGYSISYNYVYNEGRAADGIFVIGIQFLSIILLSRKKKKAVFIFELLAIGVFGYTVYNMFSNASNSMNISIYNLLGVGFYILAISLIASVILAYINASKK